MKVKILFKCTLVCITLFSLNACNGGEADSDGNKRIEGYSDPANTGGKLSGDRASDSAGVKDEPGAEEKK
ncbi:MAG: hypothetical protein K0Q95_267 [Bacteroidota bacterium]|jgi:hypothetical protein|nr:hypothetical protein [Bacteroidota bacterium]